jgi:isochorismate synthase
MIDPGPADGPTVRIAPLGPAFDLLAGLDAGGCLVERGGLGVVGQAGGTSVEVGRGAEAIRRAAGDALAVLRSWGMRGSDGPVAVGATGFSGGGRLSIPQRSVRRTEPGRTLKIETADGLRPFTPRPPAGAGIPHEAFADLQLTPEPTRGGYADAVRHATERISAGQLRKVVLARSIEVHAGRALDPVLLAARLRSVDPGAYTFIAPTRVGTLVGASPELLVSRRGAEVRSTPLAGSAPRSGDPEEDRHRGRELRASPKNREEHAIVVEAVAETLSPYCERLGWDPEPVLLATANVWHLATRFTGTLREPAADVLELVAALHPTPAVGGAPRAAALGAIARLEPFERGSYAGPVGWIDADGDGEWAIALRCAEIVGDRATLYAGAGIVGASDADDEVEETERKFRAFLDSLRWG